MTRQELERFEEALLSKRTAPGRASHVNKISGILRRQYNKLKDLDDKQVLVKGFTVKGLRTVAATLSGEGLGSGANYLSTWRATLVAMEVDPPRSTIKYSLIAGRTLAKFARERQCSEVTPEKFMRLRKRIAPRVKRGPMLPDLLTLLATTFMWRGIQTRAQRMKDIEERGTAVRVVTHTRKNCQTGEPRAITLQCLCAKTPICGACVTRIFMWRRRKLPWSAPEDPLAVTDRGAPVGRSALTASVRATAEAAGAEAPRQATGHSPRLSGARWWSRSGASRESIAMLGDWKSLQVLERYIGVTELAGRLGNEVGKEQKSIAAEGLLMTAMKVAHQVYEEARRSEKAAPNLCIVTDRKPRKWHRIQSQTGPSRYWRTACGEWFSPTTMSLQRAEERSEEEPLCRKCK